MRRLLIVAAVVAATVVCGRLAYEAIFGTKKKAEDQKKPESADKGPKSKPKKKKAGKKK